MAEAVEERAKSKRVGALASLWPFVRPYRGLVVLASVALVLTSTVSLVLPMAVRRVVDSFGAGEVTLLDTYFAAFLAIAALLALGTGVRYYFVTRLGERVVADIRRAVFDKVMGMSPAWFERIMTGEIVSRITTDTTLILSVIGSSVSVALRNVLTLVGGMALLALTSAKLAGYVLLLVPVIVVPIIVLGRRLRRLSRENQDWIANSSGKATEALGAVQTVQSFTHEAGTKAEFGEVTEKSFVSAQERIATRAVLTVIVIFLVFAGVVGVLWLGARDVRNPLKFTRTNLKVEADTAKAALLGVPAVEIDRTVRLARIDAPERGQGWWPVPWGPCRKSGANCSGLPGRPSVWSRSFRPKIR